jgi:hypothetical protein
MIIGSHIVIYSKDAEADRTFFLTFLASLRSMRVMAG